jgi:hypothetical protein
MKKKRARISSASTRRAQSSTFDLPENITAAFILSVSALFTILCRLRLLGIPLERDEGEYGYAGQQMLAGIPPFVSIYHVKFPGIYAVYAIIEAIFGQTTAGIHLGLLVVNILSGTILFFIGARIIGKTYGAFAVSCFFVITLSQTTSGFSANSEHFLIFFAMLGILLALIATAPATEKQEITAGSVFPFSRVLPARPFLIFYSGFSLGIAYTIKQQAFLFILFCLYFLFFKWIVEKPANYKRILFEFILYCVGAGLPFGITCLIFLRLGIFDKFWWWTWSYPRIYAQLIPFSQALYRFKLAFFSSSLHTGLWTIFWPLCALAAVGMVAAIRNKVRWKTLFLSSLLLSSFIAVSIGFSFYPHYFLLAAPSVALLAAAGAESIAGCFSSKQSHLPFINTGTLAIIIVLMFAIYMERSYLFDLDEISIARAAYGGNPFPESVEIGNYLKNNTSTEDKIAVLGSEPQIYFYSGRKAATHYIYTYEMIADHPYAHQFQTEMIKEIQEAKPKFLLVVNINASWHARPAEHIDNTIFDWLEKYAPGNYLRTGIIERDFSCWDNPLQNVQCKPRTDGYIAIYKRRE